MMLPLSRVSLAVLILGTAVHGGPLKEASISQIVNDVKVIEPRQGARPAALQDVIKDDLVVATGARSRAELLFQDKTLTRLGADTYFSFTPGTRDVRVDRGSMLLQVPKGLGGARIRAASVTASITGTTIMVEHLPGSAVKVVVLEGSLNIAVDRRPGERVMLQAGKMVIMAPETKELPKPVDADLRKLVRTSALVNPTLFPGKAGIKSATLPSMELIEREVGRQKPEPGKTLQPVDIETVKPGTRPEETRANEIAAATGALDEVAPTVAAALPQDTSTDPTASAVLTPEASLRGNAVIERDPTPATPAARVAAQTNASSATPAASLPTSSPAVSPTTTATLPITQVAAAASAIPATPTTPPARITNPNPYVIDHRTTVSTSDQTITNRGITESGGLYSSAAVNGPASAFLFESTSALDDASGIDASFGAKSGGSPSGSGIAVYRFGSLEIAGTPNFTTSGGPTDLALVGQHGVASSGGPLATGSLRSLFVGTEDGPINLSQAIITKLDGTFKYLHVHARGGSGKLTLSGAVNTPLSAVHADAEQGIHVENGAVIAALSTVLRSPGPIVLETSPVSSTLEITSATGISFKKAIADSIVNLTAPVLSAEGDLAALAGTLTIGTGGIQAAGQKITGFSQIDVAGNVEASAVSVSGALNIGGTYSPGAANNTAALSAETLTIPGGIDLTGSSSKGVASGGILTVNAKDVNVGPTGIASIKADGSDGLLGLVGGGDGGAVNLGTSSRPVTNSITVDSPISASTGANSTGVATGGSGGTVNLIASGTVTVNSTVKVSDSALGRASRNAGKINIESRKTTGTAIAVTNSGQLLSLLNSASVGKCGTVTFTSSGGDILVNGGTVQADKGTVDIRNKGAGNIALTNANIRGDVVKVGAFGANGQLIIGGGTISADTSLKLYGGSSNGQVRFTDNVTLGGAGTKTIAGKTVTIDNGKLVTIGGVSAAKVYTDNANYTGSGGNGSTTGRFGGAGATTQAFSKKPAF